MTLGTMARYARRLAAAQKVRGEGHWYPAERTDIGLKRLVEGDRHDTPAAAKKQARAIIYKKLRADRS